MDSAKLKPFKHVRFGDSLLRLEMLGGVKVNEDEPGNLKLECIFTPFVSVSSDEGKEPELKRSLKDQQKHEIAIGFLPVIHIGQVVLAGDIVTNTELHKKKEERIVFSIDTSVFNTEIDVDLSALNLDPSTDPVSFKYSNLVTRTGFKELNGLLIHSNSERTSKWLSRGPRRFKVYVHEMEIIRFYLTNSEFSCQQIFSDAFQNQRLFKDVVNVLHEVPVIDRKTGTARFVYKHGYRKADAFSLARILFEENGVALKAAQRVYNTLTMDRINNPNQYISYPRSNIPYKGKATLEITGRRLKTKDSFVFVAHKITSCTAKFPFRYLSCCDELARGGDRDSDELKEMGVWRRAQNTQNNDDLGFSVSDQRPTQSITPLETEVPHGQFTDLQNVKIEFKKNRDRTHKSSSVMPEYLENILNASTGDVTSGKSDSRKQHIFSRNIAPSCVSPDLKTFIEIIQCLRDRNPSWLVKTIPVGAGCQEEDGEWYSTFPEIPCARRITIMRQFSYLDQEKTQLRRFIAVEIKIESKYYYLFEAQRRLKDISMSSETTQYIAPMPILLVVKPGYPQCTADDFSEMITRTVVKSTWPNEEELTDFIRDYTVHGLGAQKVEVIASRIKDLITRNMNKY